jgi:hypothetical protein
MGTKLCGTTLRRWIAAGVGVACCALLIVPGLAGAAKPRVVVTPKPGQVVKTHPVRIEVRAGPEYGDLSARLNGVEVGEHFARMSRNRRVLRASINHGLRHGKNVLRVKAWRKRRLRSATVHFSIGHKRHMAGAGRDRVVPAGARFQLRGRVRPHPSRTFGGRVRWRVVKAPRASAFKPGHAAKRAAAARKLTALRSPATLKPAFKPDVKGTYVLEMKAGVGSRATTDRLTISAGPEQPLVPIATAVPAAAGDSDQRYGIRVGDQLWRAPWMRKTGDASSYSGNRADGRPYKALWQVVSLERSTLKLNWNRTYGICYPVDVTHAFICRRNDNGEPSIANPGKEIIEGGDDALVIASSHPSLASLPNGSGTWGAPNEKSFASNVLNAIGVPTDDVFTNEISGAGAGGASVIGVPGMKGSAQVALIPDGRGIAGYLTPDQHTPTPHYGFTPSARVDFNTRAAMDCPFGCSASQTIGDQRHPGSALNGAGGYLVTANDPHTLAHLGTQYFSTVNDANTPANVDAMTGYLKTLNADGSLIMITSLKTPAIPQDLSLADPSIPTETWERLTQQIVALGGTRHRFNLSAITPGDDYTLLGWSGAHEGDGLESIGKNATVRGALVPDEQYRYRPVNSTDDGSQPPNKLANLLVRPPSSDWPQNENDEHGSAAGGDQALRWFGRQYKSDFGTVDPRVAYWAAPITAATAGNLVGQINEHWSGKPVPSGQSFTQDDFDWARDQLVTELGQVIKARNYLDDLAYPTGEASLTAWQSAKDLSDSLLKDLKEVEEQAETSFNVFDMLEGLLDVADGAIGVPKFETIVRFVHVAAGVIEEAGVVYEKAYDGSSAADDIPVEADQLGDQLQARLRSTSATFYSMANIIVSDPVKLAEVGTYGGCPLALGGCDAVPGDHAYGEYSYTSEPDKAAAADLVELGVERTLSERLVPFAFPVWDIALHPGGLQPNGFTTAASEAAIDLNNFQCDSGLDFGYDNPFIGAPDLARSGSLQYIHPDPGVPEQWRVRISVTRTGSKYGWLAEAQLQHMFDSVKSGGLAIDAHDWMRDAKPTYVPASDVNCYWLK